MWPIAVMVAALAGAIVGVVALTPDGSAGRDVAMMLIPILGTLVGGVWLGRSTQRQMDDVHGRVDQVQEEVRAAPTTRIPEQHTPEV